MPSSRTSIATRPGVEPRGDEVDLGRLGVAQRVLDEVEDDLLEQLGVRERGRVLAGLDAQLDVAGRDLVGDAVQQLGERDGLELERLVPRLGPREREQRAPQPPEPERLPLDQREEAVALDRVVLRARLQHLERGLDRGQRRAELVRRVRDELALGALAPLALRDVGDDEDRVARPGAGRGCR